MDKTGHFNRFVLEDEEDLKDSYTLKCNSSAVSYCSSVSFDMFSEEDGIEYDEETFAEETKESYVVDDDRWNGSDKICKQPLPTRQMIRQLPSPPRRSSGRGVVLESKQGSMDEDEEEFTYVTLESNYISTESFEISIKISPNDYGQDGSDSNEDSYDDDEIYEVASREDFSVSLAGNDDDAVPNHTTCDISSYDYETIDSGGSCSGSGSNMSEVSALTTSIRLCGPIVPTTTAVADDDDDDVDEPKASTTPTTRTKQTIRQVDSTPINVKIEWINSNDESLAGGSIYSASLAGDYSIMSEEPIIKQGQRPPRPPFQMGDGTPVMSNNKKRIGRKSKNKDRDETLSDEKRMERIEKAKKRRDAMFERRNERAKAQGEDTKHAVTISPNARLKRDAKLRQLDDRMYTAFGAPISPGSSNKSTARFSPAGASLGGKKPSFIPLFDPHASPIKPERSKSTGTTAVSSTRIERLSVREKRQSLEQKRGELQKAFDHLLVSS